MIVIIMRKSTCKGSLCECKPVSWSQLLGNDHLVHHTHSKYCDALGMVVVTIMKMTGETTQEVRSNKRLMMMMMNPERIIEGIVERIMMAMLMTV